MPLAAAPAVACNCANTPLAEALDTAGAVFVGKVVKLEVIETRAGTDTIRATVETGGIAKGRVGPVVELVTDNGQWGAHYR